MEQSYEELLAALAQKTGKKVPTTMFEIQTFNDIVPYSLGQIAQRSNHVCEVKDVGSEVVLFSFTLPAVTSRIYWAHYSVHHLGNDATVEFYLAEPTPDMNAFMSWLGGYWYENHREPNPSLGTPDILMRGRLPIVHFTDISDWKDVGIFWFFVTPIIEELHELTKKLIAEHYEKS